MRIEMRGLKVSLDKRPVLHNIELDLGSGQVTGLIGPNGAGKSTLIRTLAGLLPYSGNIQIAERPLSGLTASERARKIAYLPQIRTVGWPLRVADLVALGRMPWRRFGAPLNRGDEAAVSSAMQLLDVERLRDRRITELSGGEQARVLAARAVAQDTPVFLADEPASGLDPAHQLEMMQAFTKLATSGRNILVSLHDLALAVNWCDWLVVLDEGRVAAEGEPQSVLSSELLASVFRIDAAFVPHQRGAGLYIAGLANR